MLVRHDTWSWPQSVLVRGDMINIHTWSQLCVCDDRKDAKKPALSVNHSKRQRCTATLISTLRVVNLLSVCVRCQRVNVYENKRKRESVACRTTD